MKMLLALVVVVLASCGAAQEAPPATAPAAAPQTVPPARYGFEVVNVYPHDRRAFTQGLLYRDGFLYESTGQVGESGIRKVELETGKVVQKRDIPAPYFGEGLVDAGDRLITLTWQHQKGFTFDVETFEPEGEWTYRGEGWGLTKNDRFVIMSDGTADLRFLDPRTLEEDHRVTVTVNGQALPRLNELEWIRGEVWANVWMTNYIVRIDPETGRVVGIIDLAGLLPVEDQAGVDVLNGIAWDAGRDRIFVTGKLWPRLFEIRLVPQ